MKVIKDQARRFIKYWRVRYIQSSGQERLYIGFFLLMLAYVWWIVTFF